MLEKAVQETLDWLDNNQLAEVEEFEDKQKELEAKANPIITRMYQEGGGAPGGMAGGMPGGMPGGMGGMPGDAGTGGASSGGSQWVWLKFWGIWGSFGFSSHTHINDHITCMYQEGGGMGGMPGDVGTGSISSAGFQ